MIPNSTYTINGVKVNEKIIPDGTKWQDSKKAKAAGFSAGSAYKDGRKLSGGTGKVGGISVHNTADLPDIADDGAQYTLATYNENMGSTRTTFYVDELCAWQNLRAGTGMCANDPEGGAEVEWCNGDTNDRNGGNQTTLSVEIIMDGTHSAADNKAKDNAARLIAWLMWKHKLSMDTLVTHTYWVNKLAGKSFSDVDKQCTNPISGEKWCPCYIFDSNNANTAYKNWKAFKSLVEGYLNALNKSSADVAAKVTYSKLSDVVGTTDASVTSIFREKGSTWISGWHNGTDIAAPANTPIKAVADGTVVDTSTMSARQDNFGNRVIIEHADGVFSVYAHMIAPALVKKGDKVKRGQIIGRVGGTGKTQNQYGNHLHLTLLKDFKLSLYNIFYTNNELLDPIKVCGMGTLKFSSLAKNTIIENGVTKNLGDLNKYYGVSDAGSTAKPSATSFKVGDIVEFTGSTHYTSSTGTRGTACKPGKAKITRIANGTAHPIHLVNDGSGSTVYGWVNTEDVQYIAKKTVDEVAREVIRGDWGNGDVRKKRLIEAGYNYSEVQARVDKLMK